MFFMVGCKKHPLPEKPVEGPFSISTTVPAVVPATGGTFTLTIDATTNGWWIDIPNTANWVAINRKYGSASVTQNITIASNKTGVERSVEVKIKSTNSQQEVLLVKQEK